LRGIRKLAWITVLILFLHYTLQGFLISVAIPERQDPSMKINGNIVIGIANLTEALQDLSNRNGDKILASYVEKLSQAASSGNYSKVRELIEEIKKYLNTTYLKKGSAKNEKTASEIATISSINNVSSGGSLSIDVNKLLKAYSSLTNNKELVELTKKLSGLKNQTLSPSESTAILKTVSEILNNLKNLPKSRRNFSLIKPPVAQKPLNISGINSILSIPQRVKMNLPKQSIKLSYEQLMPFLYVVLAFIILFIFLTELYKLKPYTFRRLHIATELRLRTFRVKKGKISDPLVNAYSYLLAYLKLLGYEKMKSETPREFMQRVLRTKSELGNLLGRITPLYELRVYGGKRLERRQYEDVLKQVWEMIRG